MCKIGVNNMFETWKELEESIINCNKCKLCNKEASIMFIGEGPGADEDRLRRTFCWKSWKINGYGFSDSWH